MPDRRGVILGGAAFALGLAGCGPAPGGGTAVAQSRWRPVPNAGFDTWVNGFSARARAAGIRASVVSEAMGRAGYIPLVVERDRNQTEFRRSLEDYLAIAASDDRILDGRRAIARTAPTLSAIAQRFGVESNVIAAVWGLESRYGTRRGDVPVISALATLAYDGRRGRFFEQQLVAALRILQSGDVPLSRMTGSWAGAMGHTQFIPTSYQAYAVDFDGDGRRDIWSDDPTDALASAAAYLSRSGWRTGRPWGMEVTLGSYAGPFGRDSSRSSGALAAAGVRPATGGPLPDHGNASVLRPAGPNGPSFVIWRNFSVLLRYNNAESYALGVGHLSDRLAGGGPIRASFPPDANGLSQTDRKRIQTRLRQLGHYDGTIDGVIGPASEAAIRAYQRQRGLAETGQPSRALLEALG